MSSVLLEREAVLNVVKTRSQETCPHVGGVVLTKITLDTTVDFQVPPEYDVKKVRRIKDANMVLRCNTPWPGEGTAHNHA